MKVGARVLWLAIWALALSGCGSQRGSGSPDTGTVSPAARSGAQAAEERSARPAHGPIESGDLTQSERDAVSATVTAYVEGLDRHDAAAVCHLLAPDALHAVKLPRARGGCEASLGASIGYRPPGGAPAWRRTRIKALGEVSIAPDRARVTAEVIHRFADRGYVSVEDDVLYLVRRGDAWLLVEPSGTLYRAVGYREPPLRALSPPPGWRQG